MGRAGPQGAASMRTACPAHSGQRLECLANQRVNSYPDNGGLSDIRYYRFAQRCRDLRKLARRMLAGERRSWDQILAFRQISDEHRLAPYKGRAIFPMLKRTSE
jgi:hypothetical protein